MKIKNFLLIALIMVSAGVTSQKLQRANSRPKNQTYLSDHKIYEDSVKIFTLQDLIPGGENYYKFMMQTVRQLRWCGDAYIYLKGDAIVKVFPADTTKNTFITLDKLSKALESEGLTPVTAMPYFSVPDDNKTQISFNSKGYSVLYDLNSDKIVAKYTLNREGAHWEYDTAEGNYAFTKENNVYVLTKTGEEQQVTNETDKGIVCGASVHQNEFGINKGLFWSPKGSLLAFYRMDETMIPEYPTVDVNERMAKVKPFRYPMAGMKSHEVTTGIYSLKNKSIIWLKTGEPKEKYLTNIAWSPDEKFVYIAELNRGQDTCKLVRYDVSTGLKDKELFTEISPKYVEPQNPIQFLPDDPTKFIWQSQRDGYNHLYLYNTDGQLIKQLTKGKWIVKEFLGFDGKCKNLFYTSTAPKDVNSAAEGSPLEVYAWKQDLKNNKRTCLSTKTGIHSVSINPSGTYMIDNVSSPTTPRDIGIIRINDAKEIKSLLSADNPYKDYMTPDIKTGTIKAADGTADLYYRLVTPPNMDKSEKHPVIVYVYGGPHAQMVTGGWLNGAGGWDIYMANRGYVMFTLDNRGSSNRGIEFENVIHRKLGETEMADQMKGIEFLKSLSFVDSERIGVHGWSYGGFMTTNLILTYPDVFKVGVAGGPVIDWSRYEIMYGERYMDHPDENPEGYNNSNLLNKAKYLKGRLLLIHGAIDPVVVWQHSLLFLNKCIEEGVQPDYFVYPSHPHNVTGKDRLHLYEKITRYFEDYL